MAEEMSNPHNRGKVVWSLASSRLELIEVDLKRPGDIDMNIPLFRTATAAESFALIQTLCQRRGMLIDGAAFARSEAGHRLGRVLRDKPSSARREIKLILRRCFYFASRWDRRRVSSMRVACVPAASGSSPDPSERNWQ